MMIFPMMILSLITGSALSCVTHEDDNANDKFNNGDGEDCHHEGALHNPDPIEQEKSAHMNANAKPNLHFKLVHEDEN